MSTHLGYTGGVKPSRNLTLPYYATPSEEILFHVSTRMSSKDSDIEQKVLVVMLLAVHTKREKSTMLRSIVNVLCLTVWLLLALDCLCYEFFCV